jgi:hypothetical protein
VLLDLISRQKLVHDCVVLLVPPLVEEPMDHPLVVIYRHARVLAVPAGPIKAADALEGDCP